MFQALGQAFGLVSAPAAEEAHSAPQADGAAADGAVAAGDNSKLLEPEEVDEESDLYADRELLEVVCQATASMSRMMEAVDAGKDPKFETVAERVTILITQPARDELKFDMRLYRNGKTVLITPVSEKMQVSFFKESLMLTWIMLTEGDVVVWGLTFAGREQYDEFATNMIACLYESQRQEEVKKAKAGEMEWLQDAYDWDLGEDADLYEQDEEVDQVGELESAFESWGLDETFESPVKQGKGSAVQGLQTGDEFAFARKDGELEVLAHNADGNLQHKADIPLNLTRGGDVFTPFKMQLHGTNREMLFLDEHRPDELVKLDLETGQVKDDFSLRNDITDDGVKMHGLVPSYKYAEYTNDNIVRAYNNNSTFTVDMRADRKKYVHSNTKSYGRGHANFTAAATAGDGAQVMGDAKGQIRMFSDISKNAKTLLPGLGDEIKGLDVTDDGNFVLATCDMYLVLIPTLVQGDAKGRRGFDVNMGKNKPKPIKLHIKHEDMFKHQIKSVKFTQAHFNTGRNITEEYIVASTGPFIITWNLKAAQRRETRFNYTIKRCHTQVVANRFRFGHQDQLVVANENNVYREALRKKLRF